MNKLLLAVLALTLSATTLSSHGPFVASAQETPNSQDKRLNGKWHFVFDTESGDREFEAEFSVDADGKVTGTWDKAPVAGTYKDGHMQLAFEATSEEANETAQLQLDGKIDDSSTITGSWAFSSYNGTFKATHPTP